MTPPRDIPASRTRSSPQQGRESNESRSSAPPSSSKSSSIFTTKTSASRDTESSQSEHHENKRASSLATSPTSKKASLSASGSGARRGFSRFLKSHKRHKSVEPAGFPSELAKVSESLPELKTKFGKESNFKLKEEQKEEQEDRERYYEPRSRPTSPLKTSITQEEIEQDAETAYVSSHEEKETRLEIPKPKVSNPTLENYIKDTIGISLNDWPYSENLLLATISLKTEKEKAKKESTRLSSVQNSIDLVKLSVDSGIPPHLIPSVFLSGEQSKEILEKYGLDPRVPESPEKESIPQPRPPPTESQSQRPVSHQRTKSSSQPSSKSLQTSTSVFKVNIPQQTQFQFHHWQKPGQSSASSSQQQQEPERKRKSSEDEPTNLQSQDQFTALKPSTPNRLTTSTHRRNHSEANVSQLRNLYENQILQQQPQQQPHLQQHPHPQQQQQVQWGTRTLGSPYYSSREQSSRPLYYQYPPPPQQPHVQQQPINQVLQSQPPPQQQQPPAYTYPVQYAQAPGPPPAFVFPTRNPATTTNYTPERRETSLQQIPQPPQLPSNAPQSLPVPPQQQHHYRGSGSLSATGSPIGNKRIGPSPRQGKSDVSFLITTPNNPPNK